jgi:MSHA pilin protein MshD
MMATVFRSHSGATLVELVITIVILGIAIVPLTMTLSFSASHSADSMIDVKVIELGQAYIEEILSKRYDDNSAQGGAPPCSAAGIPCGIIGAEAGETRALFDDVDDYHGVDDSPPLDSLGIPRPGYDRFRVEVEVRYSDASEVTAYGLDSTADAKKILVRVHPPSGTAVTFDVYRSNF